MSNRRTFFYYVIPSVLSFALSGIYAIVDGFFVGNSIGDAGLSAINIAYPITAVLIATGTGIGMGGAVKYSILNAGGHEERARDYAAEAIWMMLLFSVLLTGSFYVMSERLLSALGAYGELLVLGKEYTTVIILGTVLQVFGTGMVPFMRNYGGAMWSMIAMICGFATNVTPRMGAELGDVRCGFRDGDWTGGHHGGGAGLLCCQKEIVFEDDFRGYRGTGAANRENRTGALRIDSRSGNFPCDYQSLFRFLRRTAGNRNLCLHFLCHLHYLSSLAGRRRRQPASYESILRREAGKKSEGNQEAGIQIIDGHRGNRRDSDVSASRSNRCAVRFVAGSQCGNHNGHADFPAFPSGRCHYKSNICSLLCNGEKRVVLCADPVGAGDYAGTGDDSAAAVRRSDHDLVEFRRGKNRYGSGRHCAVCFYKNAEMTCSL